MEKENLSTGWHRLKLKVEKLARAITPQGAKNEALQVISAVLLTSEKVVINNIPDIVDVNKLIEILGDLGVKIEN